jgi:hypothetical protein
MWRIRPKFAAFSLLLGAAATYASAWGLTLWSPYTVSALPPPGPGGKLPPLVEGPDGVRGWWAIGRGVGVSEAAPMGVHTTEEEDFRHWGESGTPAYYRSGWPFVSLGSTVRCVKDSRHDTELARWDLPMTEIVHRGVNTSDAPTWLHAKGDRRLALIPTWPGFIANTVIYAGAACGVVSLVGWMRRRNRAGRNECEACGYSRGGLDANAPCPECGTRTIGNAGNHMP